VTPASDKKKTNTKGKVVLIEAKGFHRLIRKEENSFILISLNQKKGMRGEVYAAGADVLYSGGNNQENVVEMIREGKDRLCPSKEGNEQSSSEKKE